MMSDKKILEETFEKGTEIDDIMDFIHDNIKWDKYDAPSETAEKVTITINRFTRK